MAHDAKNEAVVSGMAKTLLLTGEINDALTLMKQLSGPREMAAVFNAAAVIAMRGKRFGESGNLYNIALRTVGTDPKVLSKLAYNMGIGYYRKRDIKTAHECFAIAVKLDPKNQKAKTNFAMNAARLGEVAVTEHKEEMIARLIGINNLRSHLGEGQENLDEAG
jgi:Flp pilus assembly protein TadD